MKKTTVYALLVAVMAMWGLNIIWLKLLVNEFAPVTMTTFRIFVAGVAVLLFLSVKGVVRKLTFKEFSFICVVSLFNIVGHHYFLSVGLTNTTAMNGGLILGLVPILTAIASLFLLKVKFSIMKVVGILFAFFGVSFALVAGHGGAISTSYGDVQIFLAAVSQAISFVLIKKASTNIDARLMTGWLMIVGSAGLFFVSLAVEPQGLAMMKTDNYLIWLVFIGSALLATAFGHMTYNYAMQHIGASESAVFINLNPFFALISSYLFLGESLYITQFIGFLLIVFGVLAGSGAVEQWRRAKVTYKI
ncbi:DMT family transporter [Priestia filamentosa]|uniref:DMT family transporter n=1 Tax=Priestia filamentosa TaxID=1402861 RepID=UPI003981FC88